MGPKDRGTCVDAGALSQRTKGTMGMKRLLMHTAHPILREQLVNCKLTHISPCSHIFCILLLALELISASVLFYACPYAWPRLLNQEREWVSIHQMTLENNQIEGLTLFPLSSSHQFRILILTTVEIILLQENILDWEASLCAKSGSFWAMGRRVGLI